MRRVVIDTNVLVSAMWSKDSNPFKVVDMVFANIIVPYYNDEVFAEYSEVLSREKLNFPKDKITALLSELTKNGVFSEAAVSDIPFADESDRKFYDLAIANNATLITGNLKHYPSENFIQNPLEFLQSAVDW